MLKRQGPIPSKLVFIQIFDGLFIVNHRIIQSTDVIEEYQVKLIVDCSSEQNLLLGKKSKVASFSWQKHEKEMNKENYFGEIKMIVKEVEDCLDNLESVLVLSGNGNSRALAFVAILMMNKFQWKLFKVLQFISSKRAEFELKISFLKFLLHYEEKMFGVQKQQIKGQDLWKAQQISFDALLLKNTYLNSKRIEPSSPVQKKSSNKTIKFIDQCQQDQPQKPLVCRRKFAINNKGIMKKFNSLDDKSEEKQTIFQRKSSLLTKKETLNATFRRRFSQKKGSDNKSQRIKTDASQMAEVQFKINREKLKQYLIKMRPSILKKPKNEVRKNLKSIQ